MDANIAVVLKGIKNFSDQNEWEKVSLQAKVNQNKYNKKLLNFSLSMAVLGLWFRKNKVQDVSFTFCKRVNRRGESFLHLDGVKATQLHGTHEVFSFSDLEGFKSGYKVSSGVDSCEVLLQRLVHPSNYKFINQLKGMFFDDTEEHAEIGFCREDVEEFLMKLQETSSDTLLKDVELYVLRRLSSR